MYQAGSPTSPPRLPRRKTAPPRDRATLQAVKRRLFDDDEGDSLHMVPPKLPKRKSAPPRDRARLDPARAHLFQIVTLSEEERYMYMMNVRSQFLRYEPIDLLGMDKEELEQIVTWYRWPSSQPRNMYEWHYFDIVASTAEEMLEAFV